MSFSLLQLFMEEHLQQDVAYSEAVHISVGVYILHYIFTSKNTPYSYQKQLQLPFINQLI